MMGQTMMAVGLILALCGLYLGKAVFGVLLLPVALAAVILTWQGRATIRGDLAAPFNLAVLALFVAWAVSAALAAHPAYAFEKLAGVAGLTVFGYLLYAAFRQASPTIFTPILRTAVWGAVFFALWALADVTLLLPRWTEIIHGTLAPRTSSFSTILVLLLPLIWLYLLRRDATWQWGGVCIILAACFALGGRTGWLALSVMLPVFFIFFPWETITRHKAQKRFLWGSTLIGIMAGLLIYAQAIGARGFAARVVPGAGAESFDTGRFDIWRFALTHVPDHFWFGIGPMQFRHLDFAAVSLKSTSHPHNVPLQLLVETGVIGLLLSLLVIIWYLLLQWRNYRAGIDYRDGSLRQVQHVFFCSLLAFGVASLTFTAIFHAWWYAVLMIYMAMLAATGAMMRRDGTAKRAVKEGDVRAYPVQVSIIMPAHNSARFIAQSIESVLAQDFQDWELIIADDASTDQTRAVMAATAQRDGRIKTIYHDTNQGAGPTRNSAIAVAQGRYLAFLDSDDVWLPHKLSCQLAHMQAMQSALSCSSYTIIDECGHQTGARLLRMVGLTFFDILGHNKIGCLTAMVDTQIVGKIYMKPYRTAQDKVLWLDILRATRMASVIAEPLAQYRVHAQSRTRNKIKGARTVWQILCDRDDIGLETRLWAFIRYALASLWIRYISHT